MNVLVGLPFSQKQKEKLEREFPMIIFTYCKEEEVTREMLEEQEVVIGNVDSNLLTGLEQLKWVQLGSAGTEGYCQGQLPEEVVLTNATGAYGPAISEYMVAMVFALRKNVLTYYENQKKQEWKREGQVDLIEKSTVLSIGLGDIGITFLKKMKALGCYTVGIKKRESRHIDGVDEIYTIDKLAEQLPKADIVALSLPAYEETKNLLGKEELALLKENAIVINVGRGSTLDTEALCDALEEGRIAGAALDVTNPEPLPENHRLWSIKNAIVTPHISGRTYQPETLDRIFAICTENLELYVVQRPLRNVIDFKTGYCK